MDKKKVGHYVLLGVGGIAFVGVAVWLLRSAANSGVPVVSTAAQAATGITPSSQPSSATSATPPTT